MSADKLARALRRLDRPGAVLAPLGEPARGYGVFAAGDRRARPLAQITSAQVRTLTANGALVASPQRPDGYELSEAGRARVRREQAVEPDDAFRAQHQLRGKRVIVEDDGTIVERAADLSESPLAWLFRRPGPDGRPYLARREFVAGECLRAEHARAQRPARVTSDWSATPIGGSGRRFGGGAPLNDSEAGAAARANVRMALEAVGPGLDRVVRRVCLDEHGLDHVERTLGWPRRSAKIVLKIALQRLADHYGLADDA